MEIVRILSLNLTINPVEDDPRIYRVDGNQSWQNLGIQSLLVSTKILTLKSIFMPLRLTDN